MRLSTRPPMSTKQLPQTQSISKRVLKLIVSLKSCLLHSGIIKHRVWKHRSFELRAHVVGGGLLQWRCCGITKSKDQITRLSEYALLPTLKRRIFAFESCLLKLSHDAKLLKEEKVWYRRAEDGHHKMGAHEAGRVACHASSLEWAVKLATCTFLSIKTSEFLDVVFHFENEYALVACFERFLGIYFSLLLILQFLRKIASHPLLHTASAFEACCHVELRHVLYSAAEIVCGLQMRHSGSTL